MRKHGRVSKRTLHARIHAQTHRRTRTFLHTHKPKLTTYSPAVLLYENGYSMEHAHDLLVTDVNIYKLTIYRLECGMLVELGAVCCLFMVWYRYDVFWVVDLRIWSCILWLVYTFPRHFVRNNFVTGVNIQRTFDLILSSS